MTNLPPNYDAQRNKSALVYLANCAGLMCSDIFIRLPSQRRIYSIVFYATICDISHVSAELMNNNYITNNELSLFWFIIHIR